jgi:hypothetical protein
MNSRFICSTAYTSSLPPICVIDNRQFKMSKTGISSSDYKSALYSALLIWANSNSILPIVQTKIRKLCLSPFSLEPYPQSISKPFSLFSKTIYNHHYRPGPSHPVSDVTFSLKAFLMTLFKIPSLTSDRTYPAVFLSHLQNSTHHFLIYLLCWLYFFPPQSKCLFCSLVYPNFVCLGFFHWHVI